MSTPRYFHHDTNNPPEERQERRNERPLLFYDLFGDQRSSRDRRRGGGSRYHNDGRRYGHHTRGGRPASGYHGHRRWSDERDGRSGRWENRRRDWRETEHRRGLGADGEYQGGYDHDYHRREEPEEEMAPISQLRQPLSSYIDERDENRTKLKKRKYVKGGRIAQVKKEQEFHSGSLYCDVCERHFEDCNAKACHDKSKEHRTAVSQKRVAAESEARKKKPKIEETPMKQKIMSFTAAEVKQVFGKNKMPSKFRDWADRSIAVAKRTADEDGDEGIRLAVMREIIHEFQIHTMNCTMFQESWMRKPEATGRHYRTIEPTTFSTLVHSEEEAARMVARDPAADEGTDTPVPDPVNASTAVDNDTPAEPRSRWVRGETEDDSVRQRPTIVRTEETRMPESSEPGPGEPSTGGVQELDISDAGREPNAEASVVEKPPRQITINWRMPRAAERILYANKCDNESLISIKAKQRFPCKKSSLEREEGGEKTSIDSTMEEYKKVRDAFDRSDYDYNLWRDMVEGIVTELKKRGTRVGTLQSCYQMLAKACIQAEDWGGCFNACEELVRTYSWRGELDDSGKEIVGHWILLSLFKSSERNKKRVPRRKEFSRFLELNGRMRDLPAEAFSSSSVYDCWQVWTAVLTNNYVKFFQLKREGSLCASTGGRAEYIMEELEDVVRERAVRTMTLTNEVIGERVYGYGKSVCEMGYLVRILGWDDKNDMYDEVDEALVQARGFVEGLGQGIEIGGSESHGRSGMLVGSDEIAKMKDSEGIDVETVLWMDKKFMKMQKPESGRS